MTGPIFPPPSNNQNSGLFQFSVNGYHENLPCGFVCSGLNSDCKVKSQTFQQFVSNAIGHQQKLYQRWDISSLNSGSSLNRIQVEQFNQHVAYSRQYNGTKGSKEPSPPKLSTLPKSTWQPVHKQGMNELKSQPADRPYKFIPPSSTSSTSPRIVGVQRKEVISYKPEYMRKHSATFETNIENVSKHKVHSEGLMSETVQSKHKVHSEGLISGAVQNTGKVNNEARLSSTSASTTNTENQNLPVPMDVDIDTPVNKPNTIGNDANTTVQEKIQFYNKLTKKTPRPDQRNTRSKFFSLIRHNSSKEKDTPILRKSSFKNNGWQTLPTLVRRKSSLEKNKSLSTTISKIPNSSEMNPRMHKLMGDLSLVVSVKIRIAEFESLLNKQT